MSAAYLHKNQNDKSFYLLKQKALFLERCALERDINLNITIVIKLIFIDIDECIPFVKSIEGIHS